MKKHFFTHAEKRPKRIRAKRPSYIERKLSRASFKSSLRKSRTSVELSESPEMPKSVAKKLSYHWNTLRKNQRRDSETESIICKLKVSLNSLTEKRRNSAESSVNYSRRCSRVSILDQAESLKPKDGIKKMVFSRFSRRASLVANWFAKPGDVPKSVSDNFCTTIESFDDFADEGIGRSSFDSLPYIDADSSPNLLDLSSNVSLNSICVDKTNFKALKSDFEDLTCQERRLKYAKTRVKSREENIRAWKKVGRKLIHAKKMLIEQESKRNMKKMWKDSYAGMCNRAIVLDKVISEASKQGVKVKPFVIQSTGEENLAKKRKYLGLGRKFYGFRSVNDEDLRENLPHLASLTEAQMEDHTGPGDLITLRSSNAIFRVNLRTRSVDTLLEGRKFRRFLIQFVPI